MKQRFADSDTPSHSIEFFKLNKELQTLSKDCPYWMAVFMMVRNLSNVVKCATGKVIVRLHALTVGKQIAWELQS